jgi:fatty acid desaturase
VSEQQSLGAMVKGVTEDISTLVRGEIELAKTELRDTAKTAANGGALLAVAGVTAFLAIIFLLLTLAWVLVQLGLPTWAGFGIVTLLLIIVAVIVGLLGKKRLDTVTGPERSQASIEKTKAVLSRKPPLEVIAPVADDLG